MASEILTVPEDNLAEVIAVIRAGLRTTEITPDTREALPHLAPLDHRGRQLR